MPFKEGTVVCADRDGWAEVVTDKLEACANCASARNCASTCKSTRITSRVLNDVGAKEGDLVAIYMSSASVLKSAALLYLVPVAFLILGAIIGNAISERWTMAASSAAIIFSLVGFVLGVIFLAVFSKRHPAMHRLTPNITRIIVPANDPFRTSASKQKTCGAGTCP